MNIGLNPGPRARTVKPGPRHLRTRPDPGQNRLCKYDVILLCYVIGLFSALAGCRSKEHTVCEGEGRGTGGGTRLPCAHEGGGLVRVRARVPHGPVSVSPSPVLCAVLGVVMDELTTLIVLPLRF